MNFCNIWQWVGIPFFFLYSEYLSLHSHPNGNNLIGNMEYDPEKEVKLKCVDGSPVENHGVVEAKIVHGNS